MEKQELVVRAIQSWLLLPGLGLPFGWWFFQKGDAHYLKALLVWIILIPTVLICSYLGRTSFAVLLGVSCVLASFELASLEPNSASYPKCLITTLLASLSLLGLTFFFTPYLPWPLVIAAMSAPFWALMSTHPVIPIWTYALFLGGGLAGWIMLQLWNNGFSYVFWAFSIVIVNDILAAVFGGCIKSPRPFARLSPNKSIAGYVGGAAAAVCAGFLGWFALPAFSGWHIVTCALLLAGAGSAGDLAASWVKRKNGIKDFGNALPTMGGVLDRLDSLLPTGWVFFLYVKFVVPL